MLHSKNILYEVGEMAEVSLGSLIGEMLNGLYFINYPTNNSIKLVVLDELLKA